MRKGPQVLKEEGGTPTLQRLPPIRGKLGSPLKMDRRALRVVPKELDSSAVVAERAGGVRPFGERRSGSVNPHHGPGVSGTGGKKARDEEGDCKGPEDAENGRSLH